MPAIKMSMVKDSKVFVVGESLHDLSSIGYVPIEVITCVIIIYWILMSSLGLLNKLDN